MKQIFNVEKVPKKITKIAPISALKEEVFTRDILGTTKLYFMAKKCSAFLWIKNFDLKVEHYILQNKRKHAFSVHENFQFFAFLPKLLILIGIILLLISALLIYTHTFDSTISGLIVKEQSNSITIPINNSFNSISEISIPLYSNSSMNISIEDIRSVRITGIIFGIGTIYVSDGNNVYLIAKSFSNSNLLTGMEILDISEPILEEVNETLQENIQSESEFSNNDTSNNSNTVPIELENTSTNNDEASNTNLYLTENISLLVPANTSLNSSTNISISKSLEEVNLSSDLENSTNPPTNSVMNSSTNYSINESIINNASLQQTNLDNVCIQSCKTKLKNNISLIIIPESGSIYIDYLTISYNSAYIEKTNNTTNSSLNTTSNMSANILGNLSKNNSKRVDINKVKFNKFKFDEKISPMLHSENSTVRVMIKYKDSNSLESTNLSDVKKNKHNSKFNSTRQKLVKNKIDSLELDAIALEELSNNTGIESIVLDNPVQALISETITITKIEESKTFYSQNNANLDGSGVKICILDTGVNSSIITNYATGYDFINDDTNPEDDNGHGTSVAYALYSIAPNSELIVGKVLDSSGKGYESSVLAGLQYCEDNNVSIISLSIGSNGYNNYCDDNLVAQKVNFLFDKGILIVSASGNDGSSNVVVPACARGSLAVGASTKQDELWSLTSYNNATLLLAPGVNINTINSNGESTTKSGTSMSVPFVSASAALMIQNYNDNNLITNSSNLRQLIINTGDIITIQSGDPESNSRNFSRLNMYNLLIENITNNLILPDTQLSSGNISPMNNTYTILDTNVAACGFLNGANTIFNLTTNINNSGATCITFNSTNQTLNCNGYSIRGDNTSSTTGILSAQSGAKVYNCLVLNYTHGLRFNSGSSGGIVENSTFISAQGSGGSVSNGGGIYLASGANHNLFRNVTTNATLNGVSIGIASSNNTFVNTFIYSTGFYSLLLSGSTASNNTFNNTYAQSANNVATRLETSSSNNIFNNGSFISLTNNAMTLTSSSGNVANNVFSKIIFDSGSSNDIGTFITTNAKNNTIRHSEIRGSGTNSAILLSVSASNNTFYNNTIFKDSDSASSTMIGISGNSSGNVFYANNLTSTLGAYVNDSNSLGLNYFNSTEGNIYTNVINRSVYINGSVSSTYYPSLYIGTQGSGYPYNSTNAQSKFICVQANCADYAPLTPTPSTDIISPIINITYPSNNSEVQVSNIIITGTASDNLGLAYVQVRVNTALINGTWMNATGNATWSINSNLSIGDNTIQAIAYDTANNPSDIYSVNVSYLYTLPTLTIMSPENKTNYAHNYIVVRGISSNALYVRVRVNNDSVTGTWMNATGSNNWNITVPLTFGNNIIEAQSIDTYGNSSNISNRSIYYVNQNITALIIHKSTANPRYFEDSTGKIIYLTGSHTWSSFQDANYTNPPAEFNWSGYVSFLETKNHNYVRLWNWENPKWQTQTASDWYTTPMPYMRTGPGNATDGGLKFNLTSYNDTYFTRLRSRVIELGQNNIYVSVMLFNGWAVGPVGYGLNNPLKSHPYNGSNNINGINGDPNGDGYGYEIHTMDNESIIAIEEAYIIKVIETLNDLDNVMYEVCNECSNVGNTAWQNHIIDFIKAYELENMSRQHPVGFTGDWEINISNQMTSNADFISPGAGDNGNIYQDDPPPSNGSKIIISDTDHLWGVGGTSTWAWKSFTRGLNPIYMDCYDSLSSGWEPILCSNPNPSGSTALRSNMGYILNYSTKMNLSAMVPNLTIASSNYTLASNKEILIFIVGSGNVTIDMTEYSGTYTYEWFNPSTGLVVSTGTISAGSSMTINRTFNGDGTLYINSSEVNSNTPPSITHISAISAQTPIEGTTKQIQFNFTVNDAEGNSTINISSAQVKVNFSGIYRTSSGCSGFASNATEQNISCNLSMQYYDPAGIWSINISVRDLSNSYTENSTTQFTYNELLSISIHTNLLDFGSGAPGEENLSSYLIINNTGNSNFSFVRLKAYDLINSSYIIGSGNFSINTTNVSLGNLMINDTFVNISNSVLGKNNDTYVANVTLYIYADIPTGLPPLKYNSILDWVINLV